MPDEITWKLLSVLSPLVSAFLASWLTLRLGQRRARSDAFLQERLAAVREVRKLLQTLYHYAGARVAELDGNEIGWSNPPGVNAARPLIQELMLALARNEVFLTSEERDAVHDIAPESLGLLMSAELAPIDAQRDSNLRDLYLDMARRCSAADSAMLKDLRDSYR